MSSIAQMPKTGRVGEAASARAISEPVITVDSRLVVVVLLLGAAFFGLTYRFMLKQFGIGGFSWDKPEDWGHAYVVPLISAWYLWRERKTLASLSRMVFWPGLGLMLLGVVSYVYFITAFSNHMFQGAAIILTLAGLLLLLFGPAVFPRLVFPLGFLLFAVTISEMVMLKVTFGLKLLASKGAYALLNLIGIHTESQGNILIVHNGNQQHPLNVADACAGMRMVIAFVALAAAVAFFQCRLWWQRVAVVFLAVPVALLLNVARVTVLGVLSLWDTDLTTGGAHMFIGTLLLVPAFLLFMGCVWVLKQLAPDEGRTS